jgi:uncharacterized protein (UPF0332 family)
MNQKEPNLSTIEYSKSKNTLKEIDLLVSNQLLNTAVNRLYYACYYAVSALLLKEGITARTHGGVRQMFGLHFVKPGLIDRDLGKYYSDIFDMRQTGDYDDFVEYTKEDVIDLIAPAKLLINKIEELINQE